MLPRIPLAQVKIGQLFLTQTGRLWQRISINDPRAQHLKPHRKRHQVYGVLIKETPLMPLMPLDSAKLLEPGYVRSWSWAAVRVEIPSFPLTDALKRLETEP